MARVLRLQNRVFYTIGSSGHEANALVGRLTRYTDPAFLHYRSGAFMLERARQLPEMDAVYDMALSFAASAQDPASGGRHKVWGSKPLWVLPQTSTIASQLPKAFGSALAICQAKKIKHRLPIPNDSIAVCSFGDASLNHSTIQGSLNAIQWTAHQGLPVPLLMICEDNQIGISVRSPKAWVESAIANREGIEYCRIDGIDPVRDYAKLQQAIDICRRHRLPTLIHLDVVRLMGHAGTDFEIDYRTQAELTASEANDPLLKMADWILGLGINTQQQLLHQYESIRQECFDAADRADLTPKLKTREEIMAPMAPYDAEEVAFEASRCVDQEQRISSFGAETRLPENLPPRHLAVQINQALADLMLKYGNMLVFGEDVAQKGGVYTVTKNLLKRFGPSRVFNTLLDEQTILGLAQGYANMGMLPFPEIQYLAYYHNACDQIRGEACSLQFFSNGQFSNPMVMRIASLGYQKGFGGHFHNDNSFAALRDIPGLIIGCPSRGDDAAMMLRTMAALAHVNGRVCAFLEPIALYMTKDLHQAGDQQWLFKYPDPDQALKFGEPRIYQPFADAMLIISYGNGIPMSLQVAKRLEQELGIQARVMDLRWLLPLNETAIIEQASQCERILVVDEGRRSAGISESVLSLLVEGLPKAKSMARVVGADSYTPLGAAASAVLPSVDEIYHAARKLLAK